MEPPLEPAARAARSASGSPEAGGAAAPEWESAAAGAAVGGLAAFFARDLGLVSIASAWMVGAAAGGLAWRTRARPVLVSAALALGVVWIAAAWTRLTPATAQGLVRRDPEQHADAILVLGSRLQTDGEPTAPALTRLLHGLELLRQGWAPRLILPELPPPSPEYAPLARRYMDTFGLMGELVSVGPVHRTRDEALRAAALCRERGLCRILVVTSPTHSRRACEALEREGLTVFSSPALETRFDLETLDRPDERLPAFASALYERAGLWYYGVRGWIGPARPPSAGSAPRHR